MYTYGAYIENAGHLLVYMEYIWDALYMWRAAAASISLIEYQIDFLFSENVDRASIVPGRSIFKLEAIGGFQSPAVFIVLSKNMP